MTEASDKRDAERRKRPTELAEQFINRFARIFLGRFPPGERFFCKVAIADLIRRERAVIFKLRDTAAAAAWALRDSKPEVAAPLFEAVEFADLADEDRPLPNVETQGEPPELIPSRRVVCNRHGSLNNGWWYHFDFQDDYSGHVFAVTFDTKSGIILKASLEGASAEQVARMFAFALDVLRNGRAEQPEMKARGEEI